MSLNEPLHFLIVEDDSLTAETNQRILLNAGFKATIMKSSVEALEKIPELQPDCVLSDLMMPQLDGHDLYLAIRKIENIKQPKYILLTGKDYEYDRKRSRELGIDGYLIKPMHPGHLIHDLLEIIHERMTVQFWGVRGSMPIPGKKTIMYGGNTNCVSLSFAKREFLIFDSGTGIKELSNHLFEENLLPLSAKIFITHPHHDHIHGFPFFMPFYVKGNEFEIFSSEYNKRSMKELLERQMDGIYFPVTMDTFAATMKFKTVGEESWRVGELEMESLYINHPGRCLGYKVKFKDKIFCYMTDLELYRPGNPHYNPAEIDKVKRFVQYADLLVMDTAYSDEAYLQRVGWGHSCVSAVVEVAHEAEVKILALYHHEPDASDRDIDDKLENARAILKLKSSQTYCIAPHESDKIIL